MAVWCARFFESNLGLRFTRCDQNDSTRLGRPCGRAGGGDGLERKDQQSMIGEGIQSTNQRKHSYVRDNVEVGFFTDPTVCIGCKACEVACKEWNQVPDDGYVWLGNSYDNTGHLGASTWRHVMFLEQDRAKGNQIAGPMGLLNPQSDLSAVASAEAEDPFRWVFLSDVCKHCEEAGCLEACPTGSIVRTEVGSVLRSEEHTSELQSHHDLVCRLLL